MKLALLTLTTTLLTLSTAQNFGSEPACATACLSSAISKAGCAESDQACQCGPTQTAISSIVGSCLLASCPATELLAVASIGYALCAQYSLTAKTTAATGTATVGPISVSTLPMGPGPVSLTTTMTGSGPVTGGTVSTTAPATLNTGVSTKAGSVSSVATSASSVATSVSVASSGSSTTSALATASSSAATLLLTNGIGGLVALFFGVVATL